MNEADTSRRFAKRLHLFQPSLTLRFVGIDDGISSGGPLSQIVNARRDAAEIDQIEIPQRSSTEVCYSFRLEAREVLGSEKARVHDAARRRDGRLAARGAGAARRARAAHRRAHERGRRRSGDVADWHFSDMAPSLMDFRFRGKSGQKTSPL